MRPLFPKSCQNFTFMALSSLPPTRIIPLSSLKGLRDLNSPFSILLCKVFCACFTQKTFARCSSSGDRGHSFPSCPFLLNLVFSASLRIRAVTRVNLRQLENADGSIASSSMTSKFQRHFICQLGLQMNRIYVPFSTKF